MKSRCVPAHLALASLAIGCITVEEKPGPQAFPKILDLPHGMLPAGAYHSVQLFFEIDPADAPDAIHWMEESGIRQLPPIVPEIEPGGREVYHVRDVHRVDFYHDMFEVGGYAYPRLPNARLYVFKKRTGNFSFAFHGQGIVVPSDVPWIPAIYYYAEEEAAPNPSGTRRGSKSYIVTREHLQVGLARIETVPQEGIWLVNDRKYLPDTSRPLELDRAVHAQVAR